MVRVARRRCTRCGKLCCKCSKQDDRTRGHAASRGYDYQWQVFRRGYLQAHPICYDCGAEATDLHHIVKLKDRPDLKYDEQNLLALCYRCHQVRTSRGE